MDRHDGFGRRRFLELTGGGLAALSAGALLTAARAEARTGAVGYFARFGITERLLADTLAVAMERGGDAADVFVQHRIVNDLILEDGAVNRAGIRVELGAGVRVVKGDQTGYGYTEDLSPAALAACARTAAAISDARRA
ncbi:MAG: DNA gyrase modulator [Anaeromyxobacter sp.]